MFSQLSAADRRRVYKRGGESECVLAQKEATAKVSHPPSYCADHIGDDATDATQVP